MANIIGKVSNNINSESEEEISQVAQIPQVIDFSIIDSKKKYIEDAHSEKSKESKELKKKIEHIKNVMSESNISKDVVESIDNVLNDYENGAGPNSFNQLVNNIMAKEVDGLDEVDESDELDELDESESDQELSPPSKKKYYNKDKLISILNESEENNKDFVDVEINTNGLDHDHYANLSFKNKMKMGKSIGFCETCNKYYPDFIVVEHDGMQYCWHCLFWLTSTSMFGDKELEQTYGLTPEKYIEFCGPIHNKAECIRSAECILCNNCLDNTLLAYDGEESTEDFEDLVLELYI